jgi:hypothetical protein
VREEWEEEWEWTKEWEWEYWNMERTHQRWRRTRWGVGRALVGRKRGVGVGGGSRRK